jgi:hypothetical protein
MRPEPPSYWTGYNHRMWFRTARLSLAVLLTTLPAARAAQTPNTMNQAKGTFDVMVSAEKDSPVGRQILDKQYHGDLEATGKGEMLSAMSAVEKSGTYVAIEKISGTLQGRKGEFAVHHVGTMTRGRQSLLITVVPDSGTGQLVGLTGTMTIEIKDGKHFYAFEYSIPK